MTKNSLKIVIDSNICTGCRVCELICAFVHTGSFSVENSRIHVEKDEFNGKDIPFLCLQCNEKYCISSCPTNALTVSDETGAVLVDENLCIGCGVCMKVCPYNAIKIHQRSKKALICDLCDGEPECVKRCPVGALSIQRI
ncbi:MAG: 4Fe-4S dicluster domain-containing protein [Thermotogae bacterium]|nr:4Fe-4S dicluster domain-containing protein [Thermotogota bacterium]